MYESSLPLLSFEYHQAEDDGYDDDGLSHKNTKAKIFFCPLSFFVFVFI